MLNRHFRMMLPNRHGPNESEMVPYLRNLLESQDQLRLVGSLAQHVASLVKDHPEAETWAAAEFPKSVTAAKAVKLAEEWRELLKRVEADDGKDTVIWSNTLRLAEEMNAPATKPGGCGRGF